ncbi:hypothetical protein [Tsuneonella suprasediminis]|uniref:hypothetical protein n=1 Tax=Tsuneonella suprasediminis TaxID=2306996 RepID=UPI002F958F33
MSQPDAYQARVVAFLDILGFSRLVADADDPGLRAAILQAVHIMRDTLAPNEASDFRFTQFSDCTVLSARLDSYGCNLVMTGAIMLAVNLLNRGLLLRGGIAIGNMIHTAEVMFGPGFLAAFGKDARGAMPRIAIDTSLVEKIASWPNDFGLESLIRRDPYDLSLMLHTLHDFEIYDAVPRPGGQVLEENSAMLAKMIASQCYSCEHLPPIVAKWIWMERYWNESVSTLGILSTTDAFATKLQR